MMRLIYNQVKASEYTDSIINFSYILDTGISLNISGGLDKNSYEFIANIVNSIIKDTDENTVYGNISKDICQNAINELKNTTNILQKRMRTSISHNIVLFCYFLNCPRPNFYCTFTL